MEDKEREAEKLQEQETEEQAEQPQAAEAGIDSTPTAPPETKNAVEKLYDKIPVSYRQVDIAVKVLIGAFAAFLLFIVLRGMGVF